MGEKNERSTFVWRKIQRARSFAAFCKLCRAGNRFEEIQSRADWNFKKRCLVFAKRRRIESGALGRKNSFIIIEDEKNLVSVIPGRGKNSFCVAGKSLEIDAVFPCVHGTNCEDGILQGLLETAAVPYVGCSVAASALTMDKEKTKQVWQNAGLLVVPYVCVRRADLNDGAACKNLLEDAISKFGFPLFVKPCNAGSSVGAAKATNAQELSAALDQAFLWDNKVLIEKSIDAREIECSVTGNSTIQNEKIRAEESPRMFRAKFFRRTISTTTKQSTPTLTARY